MVLGVTQKALLGKGKGGGVDELEGRGHPNLANTQKGGVHKPSEPKRSILY